MFSGVYGGCKYCMSKLYSDRLLQSHSYNKVVKEAVLFFIKRLVIAVMAVVLFSAGAVPAAAAENPIKVVLEDAIYGGLVGTLLGTATLAFYKHKSDHLDNIGYGAALGVMVGTGIGVYSNLDRPFAAYDNGTVKLALPTIMPEFQENSRGQMVMAVKADLLRGIF